MNHAQLPDATLPDLAFLVSDSRSGSTILAKSIDERVRGVAVTPEINIPFLLRWLRTPYRSPEAAARALADNPEGSRNFDASMLLELRREQLALPPGSRGSETMAFAAAWVRREAAAGRSVGCLVIKGGDHTRHWRLLLRETGQRAAFIHLCRDPRVVIASKLRTARPYHPWEKMAWGGPLLAGIRWNGYCSHMHRAARAGARVLDVSYEQFVTHTDQTLAGIADFIGQGTVQGVSTRKYQVPASETGIHGLATSGGITASRIALRPGELSTRYRSIIECLCQREMLSKGYLDGSPHPAPYRLLVVAGALPLTLLLVMRHYARHAWRRIRRVA